MYLAANKFLQSVNTKDLRKVRVIQKLLLEPPQKKFVPPSKLLTLQSHASVYILKYLCPDEQWEVGGPRNSEV